MHTTSGDRPNILWIVSEDCPPWLGCYGDALARTPSLDALAERGVLYERAYSAAPVCAPSRFAMLTGVPPESHAPADRMRATATLPDWMSTYPEMLRDAGYYCTNNAKTDYNCDVDEHAIWDESSRQAHWRGRPGDARFLAVFNFDGTHESSVFDETSAFARAIAHFGSRPAPEEDASSVAPGDILLPAYLPDTPAVRQDFARYYGAVHRMDAFVGDLLAQLEADGLAEDTVVVYTSDHGGVMPRSKRYLYEEGTHVPLIVAAPPRWAHLLPAPGTRWAEPVSTLSMAPTLLALAGIPVPAHIPEAPLLRRDPAAPGRAFSQRGRMDERFDTSRAVRTRRYRYVRNYTPHRPVLQHQAFAWNACGYRSWETEYAAGRLDPVQARPWRPKDPIELYDLDDDPDEVHNLAGDPEHAQAEAELAAMLRSRLLDVHDNGFLAEDSPACGWEESRVPGAYDLSAVLDIADAGLERDPAHLSLFLDALAAPDPTIRRWAAIGILALAPEHPAGEASAGLRAIVPRLRAALGDEPGVAVPAAEALARIAADDEAYAALAGLAAERHTVWTRLEALNALTWLDLDRVRPYAHAVRVAAESTHEYLGSAGRYLSFRLDGSYTPDSAVFDARAVMAGIFAPKG